MTIQYDHQIFCNQQFGGISRYFYELISGLRNDPSITTFLDVKYCNNVFLQKLQPSNNRLTNASFKGKKDLVKFINGLNTFYLTRKNKFDIFHPTYFHRSCIGNAQGKPMVLTVYDLIDEKYHSGIPAFQSLLEHRKATIRAASQLIAISENTKKDIIEHFAIAPEKIAVTHLGNSLDATAIEQIAKNTGQQPPYLLFVGSRKGAHKNFDRFLKAMSQVLQQEKDLQLVFGGGGDFTAAEADAFKKEGIEARVRYEPIKNDSGLIRLYKNALIFIYPSLYEGFGLPILEAFSCSVPCIISAGSSIREVGADAAAYFDPLETESIASSVLDLLYDTARQEMLVKAGHLRSENFSWNKTVTATKQIYRQLLP
ncbi:MAG: hypothetical protein RLZZ28_828 [Bacteroidota bacterium]